MQNTVNFIRGSVTVEVCGAYPERFINLCARECIRFWDMENIEPGVFRITLPVSDFRRIRPVARKSGCRVRIIKKSGLPFFTYKFRRRGALLAGCAVFCLIAWVFTSFVWVIEINGFEGLDRVQLLAELSENGIKTGAYIPRIERSELRNNILLKMPELAYVYVNFNGCHATVTAKKRTLPPEILPEDIPCDIISDHDGIISDITVKSGTPEVMRGDTVTRGELLVSGYMTGRAGATVITHADAIIKARTWRKISARIPKKQAEKVYSGRERTLATVILFGKRIKLYFNSGISYMKCDKIINKTDLTLPGGMKLPLSLERATYREYELQESTMDDGTAFEILGDELHRALDTDEDTEVADIDFVTSSDASFAYATITAECVEEIGEKKEILKIG